MKSEHTRESDSRSRKNDFQKQAEQKQPGLIAEFGYFVLHEKKWWLIPIVVVLLLIGALLLLSGTGAAPFIYTLF
jgi:hypothetical protein